MQSLESVGGGSICEAHRARLAGGRTVFCKSHRGVVPELFSAEAAGLRALRRPGGPRVPEVLAVEEALLVLEDLGEGRASEADWERFGAQLAALHRTSAEAFGFERDNFIGRTPQRNPWTPDGPTFFAEQRLLPLGRACRDRRGLGAASLAALERLAGRLPDLLPDEPPALIHGDLWTGNVHPTREGTVALIDPATHFGYREADLAMTQLFGSLPATFYSAYDAAFPRSPGARERVGLFNLYHLLNHLLLFGGSYGASVERSLEAYA